MPYQFNGCLIDEILAALPTGLVAGFHQALQLGEHLLDLTVIVDQDFDDVFLFVGLLFVGHLNLHLTRPDNSSDPERTHRACAPAKMCRAQAPYRSAARAIVQLRSTLTAFDEWVQPSGTRPSRLRAWVRVSERP